jgi:hypothetical protein
LLQHKLQLRLLQLKMLLLELPSWLVSRGRAALCLLLQGSLQ